MKFFEIIEEGRLSKSEMSILVGGSLYCPKNYTVLDPKDCNNNGASLAICMSGYSSCASNGTNKNSCTNILGYSGTPYGGGDETPDTPETPDTCTGIVQYGVGGGMVQLGGPPKILP